MAKNKKNKTTSKSVFNDIGLDTKSKVKNEENLKTDIIDVNVEEIKEVVITEEIVDTLPTKSQNDTFFEKFEKTKKDFSKEKRKNIFAAKKNISTKFKSSTLLTKINDSKFLKMSWLSFILIGIFITAYSSVVLGFLANYFNGSSDPSWSYINVNLPLTQISIVCAGIALALIVAPYVYLTASWFVGINSVYKSASFFIFNMSCLLISFICMILIICTSSIVFNFVIGFKPITA
ncbi:MAG: hypothetical protein RR201_02285 [Malacoplasma sp.]